jgi:ABC-type branched-subunit amino acid transport system ATPase component/ABC-type branched-subunit amino acid transport system permease subunit
VNDILTFVVAGLTIGSLYGLTATGLTLTYKTSGILNFAHGSIALIAVDAYIYLAINRGWVWQAAAIAAVFVVGPVVGILFGILGRRLVGAPPALRVAATVGVSVAISGAAVLVGPHLIGPNPRFQPPPLPLDTVEIAGVFVGQDQIIIVLVSLVAVTALSLHLRFSRTGVALRAVVDDADLIDCSGRDPRTLRRLAWMIGTTFGALSGVLLALAPTFGGRSGTVAQLVIPSFGAAAIGRFSSLPGSYAGGLAIGVGASLLTRFLTIDWLRALPAALPVIVLFAVLICTPRRHLAERWRLDRRVVGPTRQLPRPLLLVAGPILVLVLVLVPPWAGFDVNIYTTWLVYSVVFLSLGLLVRTSGQVSLCHLGLAAVGAAAFARFAAHGIPWPVALLGAGLATAAVGAVIAASAIRLAGVFLALATLAFGSILVQFFYTSQLMFGREIALAAPRPSIAESDDAYYYLVLAIVLVGTLLVLAIGRTRLGRLLRGMADAPSAVESQGGSPTVIKFVVFALSAGLAGIAGGLMSSLNSVASATPWGAGGSLTLVAILFVLPLMEPFAALAAAAVYYLLPLQLGVQFPSATTSFVFGSIAVVVVAWPPRRRRRGPASTHVAPPAVIPTTARRRQPSRTGPLVLEDVAVHFGGVRALDGVSLEAPIGRITGLIGPNGAGKTTLFNVSTGVVRPQHGVVRFDGERLGAHLGPAARARRGIGRSFQQPALFESMTVGEVLALGREAGLAGVRPWAQVVRPRADAVEVAAATADAARLARIADLLDAPVSGLSAGQRRLVELARCLAGPFDLLLLDEPSAGLDRLETEQLAGVVRDVVAQRGTGILLVEHDMALVLDLCEHIYVLDFGRLIFEGDRTALLDSDVVRAAYLGNAPIAPLIG